MWGWLIPKKKKKGRKTNVKTNHNAFLISFIAKGEKAREESLLPATLGEVLQVVLLVFAPLAVEQVTNDEGLENMHLNLKLHMQESNVKL